MIAEVTGEFPAAGAGFVTFTPVTGGPTSGARISPAGSFRMQLPCGTYRVVIVTAAARQDIPRVVIDAPHFSLT